MPTSKIYAFAVISCKMAKVSATTLSRNNVLPFTWGVDFYCIIYFMINIIHQFLWRQLRVQYCLTK